MPIVLNEINLIEKHNLITEKLSQIKLIVMDLDGTVLDHANEHTEEIQELSGLCKKLLKLNISSMVATGRTLSGSKHIIKKLLNNTSVPIITYNGSLIVHNNNYNILEQKYISIQSIKEILETCQNDQTLKILFYYFLDSIVYYEEHVQGWTKAKRMEKEFNQQIIQWVDNIHDLQNIDRLPSAILIDISENINNRDIAEAIQKIQGITVTSSGDKYIEIRPYASDKGQAIKKVSDYLNIKDYEILAIGDNDNDVEMISFAGVGVSISTASDLAKMSSDFITNTGAFEGVLDVLRLIMEINRLKGKKNV